MGTPRLSGVEEGLSIEGRRHRVGLGLLDERGGIRSQGCPHWPQKLRARRGASEGAAAVLTGGIVGAATAGGIPAGGGTGATALQAPAGAGTAPNIEP